MLFSGHSNPENRHVLPVGCTLEGYQILEVLGQGGFGITYLAYDINLDAQVALKECFPKEFSQRMSDYTIVASSEENVPIFDWAKTRFLEEARLLRKVPHRNIVGVSRFFEANNTAYMVMDFVSRLDFKQWMKRNPQPPEEVVRRMLTGLLAGLQHIHAYNALHRDVSPENILIREDGEPVLIDFGSSRVKRDASQEMTGVVRPGYSPVEQYTTTMEQGQYTDIYALSGVMVHVLTNSPPPQSMDRWASDPYKPLTSRLRGRYTVELLNAVDAGFAVLPQNRPQTVGAFFDRMKLPDEAPRPLPPPPVPVRPKVGVLVAGASLAMLLALACVLWVALHEPKEEDNSSTPAIAVLGRLQVTSGSLDLTAGGVQLEFEPIMEGDSGSEQDIEIANTGNGTLSQLSVILSGEGSSEFQLKGHRTSSLANGSKLQCKVTMLSQSAGEKKASLRITAREDAAKEVLVTLVGRVNKKVAPPPPPLSNDPRYATTDRPYVNKLGMKFVPVIPGVLFCIHPTRVKDYETFAASKGVAGNLWRQPSFPPGSKNAISYGPDYPVVNVDAYDALSFCEWLSKQEGFSYRLPRWGEYTSAWGQRDYPWGDTPQPRKGDGSYNLMGLDSWAGTAHIGPRHQFMDGYPTLAPVQGSSSFPFKPNEYGLYGIGTNIFEWSDPKASNSTTEGVALLGASWLTYPTTGSDEIVWKKPGDKRRIAPELPGTTGPHIGFRCVLILSPN